MLEKNATPSPSFLEEGVALFTSIIWRQCLLDCTQVLLQAVGLNKIRMGKISSRPAIIHRDITPLDREENAEKFPVGPMDSKPGPTLLTQVREALKDSAKENPSKEMIRAAPNTRSI